MPDTEALLLIAHGSARYPDAAGALHRHAEALRAGPFGQVEIGLLNGAPSVADALRRIAAPVIRAVPVFMESGYFTAVAVPRAVAGDARVRLCPPVGIHPDIASTMAAMGAAGCAAASLRTEETALLLVGHGSARTPGRPLALHDHAAAIRTTGRFGTVGWACLEEPPTLAEALRDHGSWPIVVVGCLAGEGTHARDDIAARIAAEQTLRGAAGPVLRYQGFVGEESALRDIILAQATATGRAT